MSKYTIGIDYGTSGVRVGIFTLEGETVIFCDEPLTLYTPHSGWAEQDPDEWWSQLCKCMRRALSETGVSPKDIVGIGSDMTCCTVLFTDENVNPLRPAIMWMDVRAAKQAEKVKATQDPALKYNGFSNVSAEWMPCKALWVAENEPEIYAKAAHVMECTDWLTYKLCGKLTASINNATVRWYYDIHNGGFAKTLYEKIGLGDILDKFPQEVRYMGDRVGALTKQAADALGLVEGIPVAQGGADAYVGMFGLNVTQPGSAALITGSSHLLLGLCENEINAPGIFGAYPDAVIRNTYCLEGGQISTGSIVNWFKNHFCGEIEKEAKEQGVSIYDILNAEAEKLPIGAEGLVLLDYFQGNRTPHTDPNVRGMLYGLSLKHRAQHIYRAIVEGICYGTEQILNNFRAQGYACNDVYLCGGIAKSKFWLQVHADVSNVRIHVPVCSEAPCMGAAVLGAVAGGAYSDIQEAAKNMVKIAFTVEPDLERHEKYAFYAQKYRELYPLIKEWANEVTTHMEV